MCIRDSHCVAENLTILPADDDVTSTVLLFAFGLAAKLERTAINDRIAAARARIATAGGTWGRPPRMTPAERATAATMRARGASVRAIARALGIPYATIGRALRASNRDAHATI